MEDSLDDIYNEYYRLYRKKRWDEALPLLEKCRDLDPRNELIHRNLLDMYGIRGSLGSIVNENMRYIEALSFREEYARIREIIPRLITLPTDREKLLKWLVALFKERGPMKDLNQAILLVVSYYMSLQKHKHALALLEKICEENPSDREAWLKIALLFDRLKQTERALQILRELLQDCLKEGSIATAERIAQYITRVAKSQIMADFTCAEGYFELRDFERASEHYTNILKADKNNRAALLGLGKALASGNKRRLAIKAYYKVLENHPEDVTALKGAAMACRELGDIRSATDFLMKASRAYARQGLRDEAREALQEILELDQGNETARKEMERLLQKKPSLLSRPASAKGDISAPLSFRKKDKGDSDKIRKGIENRDNKTFRKLADRRAHDKKEDRELPLLNEGAQKVDFAELQEEAGQKERDIFDFEIDIDDLIADLPAGNSGAPIEKSDVPEAIAEKIMEEPAWDDGFIDRILQEFMDTPEK